MNIKNAFQFIVKPLFACSLLLGSGVWAGPAGNAGAAADGAVTFTVTTTADAGPGSLRAAIEAANAHPGADTIVFAITGDIDLASQLPVISDEVTITGSGREIRAAAGARILETAAGVNVRITDLVFKFGEGDYGGAMLNAGNLELRNCSFWFNHGVFGAAIYNTGSLALVITTFGQNETYDGDSGAIYNTGTLAVRISNFSNNYGGAEGGVIHNLGAAHIDGAVFQSNRSSFEGGAIFNRGQLEVNDARFLNNQAGDDYGGAISNYGDLVVTHSRFEGNSVNNAGGAIANLGSMQIDDSYFLHNYAKWGGAVYIAWHASAVIKDIPFEGNGAGHYGGAILNNGELHLERSALRANSALDVGGGGIFNTGSAEVLNTTFSGNYLDYSLSIYGAAIYNSARMHVAYSTFVDNQVMRAEAAAIFTQGVFEIERSLIAGTVGGPNCSGPLTVTGPNMSDDDSCAGFTVGDPLLGPYQDNGGPTFTHALLLGSPAADIAQDPNCPAVDQRGEPRPVGPDCDLGAYEMGDVFVRIDIKPKTPYGNKINLANTGTIPVAILSRPGFNALADVIPGSLTFGVTGWENTLHIQPSGKVLCSPSDANDDGLPDLVCLFDQPPAGFACGVTQGVLRGELANTQRLKGSDAVQVVPCP